MLVADMTALAQTRAAAALRRMRAGLSRGVGRSTAFHPVRSPVMRPGTLATLSANSILLQRVPSAHSEAASVSRAQAMVWLAAATVFACHVALKGWHLSAASLWLDEAGAVHYAQRSIILEC